MRPRFLARTAILDLLSLAVGVVVASLIVFDRLLPWQFGSNVWPMLSYLALGLLLGTVCSTPAVPTGLLLSTKARLLRSICAKSCRNRWPATWRPPHLPDSPSGRSPMCTRSTRGVLHSPISAKGGRFPRRCSVPRHTAWALSLIHI